MKAELGFDYGNLVSSDQSKQRNCRYVAPDVGIASVHFQFLAGAGDFVAVKAGFSAGGRIVNDINGLGDQAFSSVLSAGGKDQNTIGARKGTLVVIVSSTASLDKEKAFIAKLLG